MDTKAGERRLRVGDRLVENDRRWRKIQFARPGCGRGFGAGVVSRLVAHPGMMVVSSTSTWSRRWLLECTFKWRLVVAISWIAHEKVMGSDGEMMAM